VSCTGHGDNFILGFSDGKERTGEDLEGSDYSPITVLSQNVLGGGKGNRGTFGQSGKPTPGWDLNRCLKIQVQYVTATFP
jgi:hypothetical protein